MKHGTLVLGVAAALLLAGGCKKESVEDQGTSTAAYIAFLTDSGLVHSNDTVGVSDTLHVEVKVTEGDDEVQSFLVHVSYNGGSAIRKDSVVVGSDPFYYDGTLIMGSSAGTEKWTFTALEADRDRTMRSLTFVVQ